jgi:phenylalanyl-tRNA synthetase beta chain
MLFGRGWLADYVELPESVEELAECVTSIGFPVEGIEEADGEVILDLEVNPNRPDCMNHLGMAREVAAALGKPLRRPGVDLVCAVEPSSTEEARVQIDDPEGCPRYVAVVVKGVRVGPSPDWLATRLESVGLRPINNIVDITNYVLWEYGQPLHAFDLELLKDRSIIVRRAREGEHLVTLDGEGRGLDPEILVIADADSAVALAGIMGGEESEVSDSTTEVLIESAHFSPVRVRRGVRKLGMHTDASHRFERGSDPVICLEAALRAASLMTELGGGEVVERVIDARKGDPWSASGRLSLAELNAFAGTEIPRNLVVETLPALGFTLEEEGDEIWRARVPSWRKFDVEVDSEGEVYPAHFYEEVLRFHGYDRVPSTLPHVGGPDAGLSTGHRRRESLRRFLSTAGLAETITYGFYSEVADRRFLGLRKAREPLRLGNALSDQYSLMCRSLLPNLVEGARFNQNRGLEAVRLFEIGHVFPGGGSEEIEAIGLIVGGSSGNPWRRKVEYDLFDLKGVIEGLAGEMGEQLGFKPESVPGFVAGTASEIHNSGGQRIGYLGQVDDSDSLYPLFAAELEAKGLGSARSATVAPPSLFPGISVDLTLTHAVEVRWSALERAIVEASPEDLREFGLKDRYRGRGVPEGAVNTTIFFFYNAEDRSLTQQEVNDRHQRLAERLEAKFGWRG